MASKTTAPAAPAVSDDPFAGLEATPVEAFPSNSTGRVRAPFSATLVAMVKDSWNGGKPQARAIAVKNEVQANAIKRELARIGKYAVDAEIHGESLTVLTKVDDNKRKLTFVARPQIKRERKPAEDAA